MKTATRKPKLPSYLAFPLGYQLVSQSLKSIDFADSIELLFTRPLSATKFGDTIKARESYPVMVAEFVRWDRTLSSGDDECFQEYYTGKWSLRVYPCASELRAEIRDALVRRGLPAVNEWFLEKRPDSWYFGRKQCEVWIDPSTQEISTKRNESAR